MKRIICALLVFLIFVLPCCSMGMGETTLVNACQKDSSPPVLVGAYSEDEYSIRVVFDKTVKAVESSFYPFTATSQGFAIVLTKDTKLDCSKEYIVEGMVEDISGNTTYVSLKVWGYNPNPATLIFNEVTTKGRDKQPDRTELLVTQSGSLSGFVLYDGIPSDYKTKVMLGNIEVNKGDFVVIWWTESFPETIKEHPASNVWNICAKTTSNPSENNGIQTISESPSQGAKVVDCFVYSSFENTQYSGFGTKEVYERVARAIENSWWSGDAVSSMGTTSTRSMFRLPGTFTRQSCKDWKICPTGKASFGSANGLETY